MKDWDLINDIIEHESMTKFNVIVVFCLIVFVVVPVYFLCS